MIIRKPYAFLIKHFKLIHFVMLVLSIYIVNRANIIFNFFNEYVTTRQVSSAEYISSNYLPLFLFISSILIITLSIIIFILLKQKDKPKLLYIIIIIYYILFIIFLIIAGMVISTIYIEGLSPQLSRIYRDISLIALIIQIIFIVLIAIRAVGFDIKKFHFGEDLQELQIEVTDNEEIEITSGIDFDKISRNLQIKKEDFKSFYIENKAMIIIILFLMIIVIPGSFIIRNIVNNKHFQQGEIIKLNNFDMSIKSSYTTKYNYNGNLKLKENKSYLIIEFYLKNNKQKKSSINLNSLTLESNNHIYSPNTSNYNSFIDIGIGYDSQALLFNEEKKYIAVFIVDDEDITNNMNIRYTDDPTSKILNYKRIDIMPMNLDNDIKKENIKIGEIINLAQMLNSKYSKVLSVVLVIAILIIIGFLVFIGIDWYKASISESENKNILEQFNNYVENEQKDNNNENLENVINNILSNPTASNITLGLIGIHIGLHWNWILNMSKKIFKFN